MMQRPLFLQPDFLLKSYYHHILKKFHCLLQLKSMEQEKQLPRCRNEEPAISAYIRSQSLHNDVENVFLMGLDLDCLVACAA